MSTAGCLTSSSYDPTALHPAKRLAKLSAVSIDREPTATMRCRVCAVRDSTKVDAILPGPMIPHPRGGASSGGSVRGTGMRKDSPMKKLMMNCLGDNLLARRQFDLIVSHLS